MKNKIGKIVLTSLVAIGGIWVGCNDAEYSEFGTHAFIEEALKASSTNVTVGKEGANVTLNVHVSSKQEKDNSYKLELDQSALDAFNTQNGTSYIALPEDTYTLPDNITIKAGNYNAEPVNIPIKAFTKEMNFSGESYALPVKLVAQEGSAGTMPITGSLVILAGSIREFSCPQFNGAADLIPTSYAEHPETYNEYTIEVRFQVSNTANRNRAVFTSSDGNGKSVLLRFEDPQKDNEQFKAHSQVQIQLHNGYVNPTYSFEPNKWQHLAVTFDGSKYIIYVNGRNAGKLDCSAAQTSFKSVGWFVSNDWWRGCNILVSEARLWSVCRSELQIQNSMTLVSPKSKGLEAYWHFNEGEGNTFEDCTGNGHTIVTDKSFKWVNGILSTDEATAWQ